MELKCKIDNLFLNQDGEKSVVLKLETKTEFSAFDSLKAKDLKVILTPWHEKRSLDANAYFHLLVEKLSKVEHLSFEETKLNMVLDYGVPALDDNNNIIGFKLLETIPPTSVTKYPKVIGQCIENGKRFNKIIVFKPTHELDTKEMSNLITGLVNECQNLGIETKTPEQIAEMLSLWKSQKI